MTRRSVSFLLTFVLLGCTEEEADGPCVVRSAEEGVLFVLSTTLAFDASSLEAVGPGCPSSTGGLVSTSGDAILRVQESGPVQILNRGTTSSLVNLDDSLLVTAEIPLRGCNAQEVVPLDHGDYFVTCDFEATARRVSGVVAVPATDLSAFADRDGIPDMAGAVRVGDRIYVAIQRLDQEFAPTGNGQLVVIDATTLQVVDADPSTPATDVIDLPCDNPGRVAADGDTLYVVCSGDFSGNGGGGIVRVNRTDRSAGLVASDAELGGYPNNLILVGSDPVTLVAVPGAERFSTIEMRAVRVREGTPEILYQSPGFSLAGLATNGTELYVGNRSADATAGVYRIALDTGAVEGPIITDVPPFSLGLR